jgi:hypothetical protein
MDNDAISEFAVKLIGGFFAGTVVPRAQIDLLVGTLGRDRPELRTLVLEAWARGNQARQAAGKPPLDPQAPLVLSSGSSAAAAGVREPLRPALDAAGVVKLVSERFSLDEESLARLNAGRRVDGRLLVEAVAGGIRSQRIVPRLLEPYLGPPGKYFEKFKDFLHAVADPRDGNFTELLQHFGLYLLLNGASQDQLAALRLATPLESFVCDRIGRVRQIFYVAMLFGYTFTYLIFAQTFEINSKYREMAEEQRAKLRKLYEAEDRLALLVSNAGNTAMRRIAEYGIEAREIQMALKKFLSADKKLVTAADLFSGTAP